MEGDLPFEFRQTDLHPERPVCVKCSLNMKVEENGVRVRLCEGQIAVGDLYRCLLCRASMVWHFGAAIHQRDQGTPYARWDAEMGEARIYGTRGGRYA